MHVGAAELLGGHHLADRGLHQRRPAEEDGALVLHDDGFVRHRRHIGAAGGARAHHRRDLRDAGGRHLRLVVEDAAEMLAIGKDLVLQRQEGAAGIDQIDARQMVVARDLLRAQVLLHRDRIIGAALDGGVVGDDDAVAPAHAADAGDDAGARRRRRRTCRARRAATAPGTGCRDRAAPRCGRAPAACRAWCGAPAPRRCRRASPWRACRAGPRPRGASPSALRAKSGDLRIDVEMKNGHPQPLLNSSRPISMRRISLVPAPIS